MVMTMILTSVMTDSKVVKTGDKNGNGARRILRVAPRTVNEKPVVDPKIRLPLACHPVDVRLPGLAGSNYLNRRPNRALKRRGYPT